MKNLTTLQNYLNMRKKIINQSFLFLINGLVSVSLSILVYSVSYYRYDINIPLANFFGCITGLSYGFLSHKKITFKAKNNKYSKEILKYILLYSFSIPSHILINLLFINILYKYEFKIIIAYLISTSIIASFNFMIMKFYIFKSYDN